MMHAGIDFGAKKAGTTVIALLTDQSWIIRQSHKNQDADKFLQEQIEYFEPQSIFIDAPLSLPKVYSSNALDPKAEFHYRKCDRATGAMSPMFLGGLTARAIRHKAQWQTQLINVFETYPAHLAAKLAIDVYKDDLQHFAKSMALIADSPVPDLQNWHQADAILAWYSGKRYLSGEATSIGDADEGLIIV
jgi:predicted nuclease with RNAse H fold